MQSNLHGVIAGLDSLSGAPRPVRKGRDGRIPAGGVSGQYHGTEQRRNKSASEVHSIIRLVNSPLQKNDGTARPAHQQTKSVAGGIG
ncbi:hypothetical protein ABT381_11480 [Streptomyces sp. NPDC000151]|uniref:hypothetical protein n=1 Tax=Streptomyces sp. NPDC000151 TaxID=3154244 RepID=UPI00332C7F0F